MKSAKETYSYTESSSVSIGTNLFTEGDGLGPKWKICRRKRYQVAILIFFGYMVMVAIRMNFNIAITAMVAGHETNNETEDFKWDMDIQRHILAAFYYGYIVLPLVGGYVSSRCVSTLYFGLAVGVPAFISMYTDHIAKAHYIALISLRVVEGLFQGMAIPSSVGILVLWLPISQCNNLIIFVYSGGCVGAILAMVFSAVIAQEVEWESLFLIFGAFGSLWYGFWISTVYRSPAEHSNIHPNELHYLKTHLNTEDKKVKHPWKGIFTSLPVLALCASQFAVGWGQYTFIQLPAYLQDCHNYSLLSAALLSAIPYLILLLVMQFTGYISTVLLRRSNATTTCVRKMFIGLGFTLEGLCFFSLGFLDEKEYVFALVAGAALWAALAEPNVFVNTLEITPQHATIVAGVCTSCSALAGIASSVLSGYIVPNKTLEEWKIVFIIAAGVQWFGAFVYVAFGSGERLSWAYEDKKSQERSARSFSATSST